MAVNAGRGSGTLAVARAAEAAVARGAAPNAFLVDLLRTRLQRERDPGFRLRLARAFLRLLGADGLPTAVRWVTGSDPMLREAAYDALHDVGERALPTLLDLLESRDPEVRWCAYEVAQHLHRPSMVPVLVRGLRDEEAANRWAAANGLIRLGVDALIPTLTALVTEPATLTFHSAARRVLARLEAPGHEDLRARLVDSLGRGTTVVQSGPIAAELLAALRHEASLRAPSHVQARPASAAREREAPMTTRLVTTIRAADRRDAPAVQRLWQECGLAPAGSDEWNALTQGPTGVVLVAELDGRVVGSVVATFDGWRAYVYHLAVEPSLRRRGLGQDLIEEAERYLRTSGARNVHAAVHEDNTEGLALAVRSGYLPEGERVLVKAL